MTTATRTSRPNAVADESVSPLKRILVATGGEPESAGAMSVAAALAARGGAQVVALGVALPFPHKLSSFISLRQPTAIDQGSQFEILEAVRRQVKSVPGTDTWEERAYVGLPADVINDAASEWSASLIVMGLGRHKAVDRLFGSETAVAVIRQARLPLLAVPADMRALPRRALAAVDFTPASIAAAAFAASLLAEDGTLFVAHVCGFGGATAAPGDLVDLYRTGARAKLEEAVQVLERQTAHGVEGVMLEGDPGEALVAYARRENCDMIAMGGHHLGLVDRVLIGSVRTRVVRDASCAVLIAPPRAGG
jgi:nucleotide-binding universal stress UspA family protein